MVGGCVWLLPMWLARARKERFERKASVLHIWSVFPWRHFVGFWRVKTTFQRWSSGPLVFLMDFLVADELKTECCLAKESLSPTEAPGKTEPRTRWIFLHQGENMISGCKTYPALFTELSPRSQFFTLPSLSAFREPDLGPRRSTTSEGLYQGIVDRLGELLLKATPWLLALLEIRLLKPRIHKQKENKQ